MKKLVLASLLLVLSAAVVAPPALAEPLRANVVSVSPNNINQADVPVSIVFRLYEPELPSPRAQWGKPIGGVNGVEVVVRGEGQVHRFPVDDLGAGRYRTEIVFPEPGGWAVRVSYGAGSYGAAGEVDLGKGGVCIAADCSTPQGEEAPVTSSGWPWTTIGVVAAVALAVVVLVLRFVPRGRRRLDEPVL